jgi:hypothetical protein
MSMFCGTFNMVELEMLTREHQNLTRRSHEPSHNRQSIRGSTKTRFSWFVGTADATKVLFVAND